MSLISAVRFELSRSCKRTSLCIALAAIAVVGYYAYFHIEEWLGELGGTLQGSSALDPFYLALNDETCAVLLYPIATLALVGDIFCRDSTGMGDLLLSRGTKTGIYVASKVATVFIVCFAIVFATGMGLVLIDAAVYHSPLFQTSVPAWLSYSGDPDFFQADGTIIPSTFVYVAIPQSWNYPAVVLIYAIAQSVLLGLVTLLFAAALARSKNAVAPLVTGAVMLFCVRFSTQAFMNFILLANRFTGKGAPPHGYIADRLCLGSYSLAAGFSDTIVGGGWSVCSYLGLVVTVLVLVAATAALLAVHVRGLRLHADQPERTAHVPR